MKTIDISKIFSDNDSNARRDKLEPQRTHQHEVVIKVENLKKRFYIGANIIRALRGVNLGVRSTEFAIIYGPSGCGKTTLINIIAGIDRPSEGKVEIRETDLFQLNPDERGIFRSKKMGIVHQLSSWVKSLNVFENVALPLIIQGEDESVATKRARRVMREIGILELGHQMPTQLSGGQQQKVALARALVTNPWIILADEPTGNLDSGSADEIMAIFDLLNKEYKRTIILVTHNQAYWTIGTRRIEMKDGQIIKDTRSG